MSWEVNTENMCRACLRVDGVLLPMFDGKLVGKDLPEKLAELTSIQIDRYDGLPVKLCAKCAYRTEAFYDFKMQVQASEEKLRKMFASPEVEIKLESIYSEDESVCKSIEYADIEMQERNRDMDDDSTDPPPLQDSQERVVVLAIQDDAEISDHSRDYNTEDGTTDNVSSQERGESPDCYFKVDDCEDIQNVRSVVRTERPVSFHIGTEVDGEDSENDNWQRPTTTGRDSESDSSDYFADMADNIVGSLNDTIVKIREVRSEENVLQYQCTLCIQNYDELSGALEHVVDNHVPATGPFFCTVCEKDCDTRKQLRSHVKVHTGALPYSCFICDKAYAIKRYLRRHMAGHTELPRHRCPKCGERFNTKTKLEYHVTAHIRGSPYICNQCPRAFNHKGNYKRHLISHLDPQGRSLPKFPCKICGKRFLNNRTLDTHMRVHTGEKPFKCTICNKSFSQQGNLLNHTKIHSNPRSYTCEVCGKQFNQRATLKDHSLLHTGEKPYVCTVCGHAFTFSAALRRHMWSHAAGKPYGCEICDSRFVGKYDLKRHMNIHNDRPYLRRRRNRREEEEQTEDSGPPQEPVDETAVANTQTVLVEEVLLSGDVIRAVAQGESEKENVDALFNLIQYGE